MTNADQGGNLRHCAKRNAEGEDCVKIFQKWLTNKRRCATDPILDALAIKCEGPMKKKEFEKVLDNRA